MAVPRILCGLLVRHILFRVHIDVRFPSFPEQILTEQIQNRRDALVRVVLVIALELSGILAQDPLENTRVDAVSILKPHLVEDLTVS